MKEYIPNGTVDRIKRRGMVVFYGAGMSYAMEIPTWQELLERLEREEGVVKRLVQNNYSLPRIAAYLFLESETSRPEFNAVVREKLYASGPLQKFFDKKFSELKDGASEYKELVEQKNPNLAALARLLIVPNYSGALTGNPNYAPNPRVAAVATTNYDDLLRSYIWEKFVVQGDPRSAESRRILRTIDRPSATPRHGMCNLYHVHGFLQLKKYDKDADRKASLRSIVLTESDYFNEFSSRSMYFPAVLHEMMSHHVCIFVGMSMTDQNINRILHQVQCDCDPSAEGKSRRDKRRRPGHHIALLPNAKQDKKVVTKLLGELKVRPVWFTEYSEISDIIKEIYLKTYFESDQAKAEGAWESTR
jgi:hypothetical protein